MANLDLSRIRRLWTTDEPAPDPTHPAEGFLAELPRPELRRRFIAGLEAVSGHALVVASPAEAGQRVARIVAEREIKSLAIGGGISIDAQALAAALNGSGCELTLVGVLVAPAAAAEGLQQRLARTAAGLVEADYGIAATGTLALLGCAERPRSLSLLPEISLVVLREERIVPNLASALTRLGSAALASHPMVLVTGPSRTADIEKRIVVGVHGPRELIVLVIAAADPS